MDRILGKYEHGSEEMPLWLKQEMGKGRGRIEYDDGIPVKVTIYTVGGTKVLKPGDVVLKLKSGMTVVPKEAAAKYIKAKEAKADV